MRWLWAFVVGGLVCYALDHQHVTWGVLSYPHPDFWQQAWWVPLLFGTATVGAVLAVEPIRRLLSGNESSSAAGLALADAATFCAAYYFTAVANHEPNLVAGVLFGTWLVRVAAGMPAWAAAFCIGMAIVGPAFEATFSSLGMFHYHHPDFIGVARWLPMLYLHVGVVAVTIGERMRAPVDEIPIEIEVPV